MSFSVQEGSALVNVEPENIISATGNPNTRLPGGPPDPTRSGNYLDIDTGFAYVSFQSSGEDLDGDGVNDPDYVEEKHGYLFSSFFKQIDDGVDILGEAWKGAITRYLDTWPPMDRWEDAKDIEAWILLGDPSLKIGGYSN